MRFPKLAAALEAHEPKALGTHSLYDPSTGLCCALGVMLTPDERKAYADAYDRDHLGTERFYGLVGERVDANVSLEVIYNVNDRCSDSGNESPQERYSRMLAWARGDET